jgi:ABC-2 type transport system ATP-binding protein
LVLKIRNLVKSYGNGPRAVDGLTLSVGEGEICGFIGHNGAGKTTTLKCISGVLPFDSGEILVGGIDIQKDPMAAKRIMRCVPDEPELYPFLTGIGYLNFLSDIYGIDGTARRARIKRLADLFEIEPKLGDLIGSFSSGTRRKLALIGALVQQPKLLLLDEPFMGLDPKAAHTLKGVMLQLIGSGGAILFSTHVLEVAEKLCSRIAIIKNGRLAAEGPTNEVRGDRSLEELFLELENA